MRAPRIVEWLAGAPRRGGVAAAVLVALCAGAAIGCRSEPETAATGQTAQLELQPRGSSFRDIGKRADSNLGGGG